MSDGQERGGIGRTLLTVLWAFVPALTLGVATPVVMIHAAARMRDWRQSTAAVFYLLITVMLLTLDRDISTASLYLYNSGLIINIVGGTGHAFAIRQKVWDRSLPEEIGAQSRTLQMKQEEALAAYVDERTARQNARAIIEDDPRQAVQLAIGRPDIEHPYPDGGLIDVNNVPQHIIASALKLTETEAESVVGTRAQVGGFASVADLSVTMDFPARYLDTVAHRLVFLPLHHL